MPNTDSDLGAVDHPPPSATEEDPPYRFAFSWDGPYGSAVQLVEALAPPGLVLDLGCGYGAVGEVLADRGRHYVGADVDPRAISNLRERRLEGHIVDLTVRDGLRESLAGLIDGRPVGAVLLLDALEHLIDPLGVLEELAGLWDASAAAGPAPPVLVTSIPNVAHFDLAAKLVGGRWDVTPSGLLDRTHLQMFTADRIQRQFSAAGWKECGRDDVILDHSDQSFPPDHPLLIDSGTARDYLWSLRSEADPYGTVNQFVRAYRLDQGLTGPELPVPDSEAESFPDDVDASLTPAPFLSVLTRTQGNRPVMLAEALSCLAAQTLDSLEVFVLVHTDDVAAVASVRALVATFADDFASRVRVEQIRGGGRAAPLNAGLECAKGRYIACLDDDDLVTADWAECFQRCAAEGPGKVVRSICYSRAIRQAGDDEQGGSAQRVTLTKPFPEFVDKYGTYETFDTLLHFERNTTPLMSFALPRSLVTELHLSFDDRMAVCEDWDFLLRAALIVGVVDSRTITAIYHRWEDDGSTTSEVPLPQWDAAHQQFLQALDSKPLLLPSGSASAIARLVRDSRIEGGFDLERHQFLQEIAAMEERARDVERDRDDERRQWEERTRILEQDRDEQLNVRHLQHQHVVAIDERIRIVEAERDGLINSKWWRLTAPLRRASTLLRRASH
jgi:SAM-dependent methyltransferase